MASSSRTTGWHRAAKAVSESASQKVEAILGIDHTSLVFIDSHPQPRQELPQLRNVDFQWTFKR
jgi:hypothetical protein